MLVIFLAGNESSCSLSIFHFQSPTLFWTLLQQPPLFSDYHTCSTRCWVTIPSFVLIDFTLDVVWWPQEHWSTCLEFTESEPQKYSKWGWDGQQAPLALAGCVFLHRILLVHFCLDLLVRKKTAFSRNFQVFSASKTVFTLLGNSAGFLVADRSPVLMRLSKPHWTLATC